MNEPDKGTAPVAYHTPLSDTPASAGNQVTQKRSEPTAVPPDLASPDVPGYAVSRKLGEGGMGRCTRPTTRRSDARWPSR